MSQIAVACVEKRFGGLVALKDVSFTVQAGEMVGLIGPNGSGKTTLLNVLSGFYQPELGEVHYDGRTVNGLEPHQLALAGLTRTFQVTKIFRRLSVLDNLLVPGLTEWTSSRKTAVAEANRILQELGLDHLAGEMASNLSGGQSKLLEFGRVMMLSPKVILLDEPFGGVHPTLKTLMHEVVRGWNAQDITIVLISHDMGSIFDLCKRVLVLHNGALIADGPAEEVRRSPRVVEAYLGTKSVRAV
ncbi:MAG: ABC transporter ATP-binding protein [Hyphomicrobiaceae bacterium]